MAPRSTATQNFIDGEIGAALSRVNLPHNHPVRPVLDAEAAVEGTRDPCVRCSGESLDTRIAQLRLDSRFANTFPRTTGKVSKNDLASLRSEFQQVAAGTILVE